MPSSDKHAHSYEDCRYRITKLNTVTRIEGFGTRKRTQLRRFESSAHALQTFKISFREPVQNFVVLSSIFNPPVRFSALAIPGVLGDRLARRLARPAAYESEHSYEDRSLRLSKVTTVTRIGASCLRKSTQLRRSTPSAYENEHSHEDRSLRLRKGTTVTRIGASGLRKSTQLRGSKPLAHENE